MRLIQVLCLWLVAFFMSACGYRGVSHSYLTSEIKTVYIEPIKSVTSDHDLASFLKQALLQELNKSDIKIVSNKSDAQGYVKINIINYSVVPASFNENGSPNSYRCMISAKLSLTNNKQKPIMLNKVLTSFEDFNSQNEKQAIEIAKSTYQKKVLKKLATLIKEDLFVNF